MCQELKLKCENNVTAFGNQITINEMCLHLDPYVYRQLLTHENFIYCNFKTVTHILQIFKRSVEFLKDLEDKLIDIINDDTTSEASVAIVSI